MSERYVTRHGAETQRVVNEGVLELSNYSDSDGFFESMSPLGEIEGPYEHIRDYMKSMLVERDEAIDTIVDCLESSGVRMENDHKPRGTFALLGPTGTGKTRLAEVLSEAVNIGERTIIKIDCAQFSHGHEITALTGSPPSYVGHNQEPLFSSDFIEEEGKYPVVLFDEIEKGSPELYNLMLAILGDGLITLNNGDEVSFKNTIIVITSNLGAKELSTELSKVSLGFGGNKAEVDNAKLEQMALRTFKDFFAPEYINRINKMIVFPPLTELGLGNVLDTHVEALNSEFGRAVGARITLSGKTKDHLVSIARQEAHLGARPLIRAFENDIQGVFGRYVLADALPEGSDMHVFRREEVPDQYRPANEKPYVFFTKHDANLKKYRAPVKEDEKDEAEEIQGSKEVAIYTEGQPT